MQRFTFPILAALLTTSCSIQKPYSDEDAITRVEDCTIYTSVEGQKLKPWELAWKDSEKLRGQLSHAVCKVYIDLKKVKNPEKYMVPGTLME